MLDDAPLLQLGCSLHVPRQLVYTIGTDGVVRCLDILTGRVASTVPGRPSLLFAAGAGGNVLVVCEHDSRCMRLVKVTLQCDERPHTRQSMRDPTSVYSDTRVLHEGSHFSMLKITSRHALAGLHVSPPQTGSIGREASGSDTSQQQA